MMRLLLCFLALTVVTSPAATDATNYFFAVNDSVYVAGAGEFVNFSGNIHVQTRLQPTDPCQPASCAAVTVHVNSQGLTGVGETSGLIYRVTEAATTSFVAGDGDALEVTVPSLRIVPPNPIIPTDPCRVSLYMLFSGSPLSVSIETAHIEIDAL